MKLRLGFSPCPNDTFAFHALVHGLVELPEGVEISPFIADVEELNRRALAGELEITKLSAYALGWVQERYQLLDAGAALGRGCGPLVVAREELSPEQLMQTTILVPGMLTTAHLLLGLWLGRKPRVEAVSFEKVMELVAGGQFRAGVIIHEGRFTYQGYGLRCIQDLGEWWEETTGLPIPLGVIAARRDLEDGLVRAMDQAISTSVKMAQANPQLSREYVRAYAQELAPDVVEAHIALYVTDYSVCLGEEGRAAVQELLSRARAAGMF